jgi:hypothetical protein
MSAIPISMSCANCGAPLIVTPDVEKFHCGFCGSQLMVERKGGTVALKKIEPAIQRVQVGTDKTAAEHALVRLEKELRELEGRYGAFGGDRYTRRIGCAATVGVFCLILGGVMLVMDRFDRIAAIPAFVIGGVLLLYAFMSENPSQPEEEELKAQIETVKRQIAETRRTVES